jgi:hypothetical protein
MARGWESKSIEAQQDEAARATRTADRPMTPGDIERTRRRQTLELSRRKAVADLERATTAAHRAMLERAIADLDDRLRNPGSG